jgi:hypothetical protein
VPAQQAYAVHHPPEGEGGLVGITLGLERRGVHLLLVGASAPPGCLQLELRPEAAPRVVGLAELFGQAFVLVLLVRLLPDHGLPRAA